VNQRAKVLGGVAAVVVAGIVATLLMPAGSSPSDTDADGARAAVEEYLEAFGERDSATICAASTPESWDTPAGTDTAACARYYDDELNRILESVTEDTPAESAPTIAGLLTLGADTFTVEAITLSGTSEATAQVSSTRPGVALTMRTSYEGGRWKITKVDG
jgi:hypothetical protein